MDDEFVKEIKELLALGYEGGYWDFKKEYTPFADDKLTDIICMANNLCNRDAYIIYGADDDGMVIGLENMSDHRLVTADFIKYLRSKKFAGDNIPDVEVRTVTIEQHELDVLIIYNSNRTPFYLAEEFLVGQRYKEKVRAGAIYTRVNDMNTDRDKTANIHDTEYLWKKRFGYDLQPYDRFLYLLDDINGWSECNWDSVKYQYYKMHPEFKISIDDTKPIYENLSFFYDDPQMIFSPMKLDYYGTTLYETEFWGMDMGRCNIPKPECASIGISYRYYYYIKNSIHWKLFRLMNKNKEVCCDRSGMIVPVMIFDDDRDRMKFENYFTKVDKLEIETKLKNDVIMQHIMSKEEQVYNGKPSCGTLQIKTCYEVFKEWEVNVEHKY